MKTKRSAKREDLKDRLIEAAQARIRASGLQGLRARDVTADAGCALGALYNAFADLDDLILHVNSLTLASLGVALDKEAARAIDPRAKFKALASAYLSVRARQSRIVDGAVRASPAARHDGTRLVPPGTGGAHSGPGRAARRARPELDSSALLVRARTLFSAVHGIVAISLEGRFIGLAATDLEDEVLSFVDSMVTGIEKTGRK